MNFSELTTKEAHHQDELKKKNKIKKNKTRVTKIPEA